MDVAESTNDSPPKVELSPQQVTARRWQLFTVALVVVGIDQATKEWARQTLADGSIDGPFGSSLRLVDNFAAAFSLGEGFGPIFGLLAIAISVAMYWIVKQIEPRSVVFGLGLVQGGAIGNVIDRAVRDGDGFLGGGVTDFLEIGDWWPVFNIADVGIVVGGMLVALLSSRD